MKLSLFASLFALAAAQDPAQGWTGYAKAVNPAGTGIITSATAKWFVPNDPKVSPTD